MTKLSGAAIIVRALEDENVPFTFGIPGTHNLELWDALGGSDRVRPVLVTDEQSASFMADAVSRSSGRLGCVNVVPGAGLTHALSGIAEAHLDGIPLLVLACGVRGDSGKSYQLHDVDQAAIVRPVSKAQLRALDGADLYSTVRRACRLAVAPPSGPVFVEVPMELYLFRHEAGLADWVPPSEAVKPPELSDIERVAEMLVGRRPLLYLGLGAGGAGPDLVRLAERLEAPVATTIQGKGVFPESHPLWLWCGFGRAAPPFVRKVAEGRDLTLAIGCRFSEVGTGSYGLEPPGKLIHVDIDPEVFNRNYTSDLAIHSDAGAFVRSLLAKLEVRPPDSALRQTIEAGHAAVHTQAESGRGRRVDPLRLLRSLQEHFGPEAIYTTDSGNGTFLAMEGLRLDRPASFLAPVDYSCMGYAVPAAIGAALACPERPVVALAGDGALLMTGLELLTARHLSLPVTVLVLRDRELAQISQFQDTALARKTASTLPDFDLEGLCSALGVEHLLLDNDQGIAEALRRAGSIRQAGRPVVVEVNVDYSRPTFFTQGVVWTNFGRLPWPDRLRFVARALGRKLTEGLG